ncbi:MAG: 30S ribosomal protein S9 [Bdellovibrionaceae bacterium]|nr:30S ribosomal protein S9 [Pseudobdellovibrionaceae bacterium]
MAAEKVFYATGRRKTSSARVYMRAGSGKIIVNGLKSDDYLKRLQSRMVILQPFDVTNMGGKFDIDITVTGGGESGQMGAIRLGIARALTAFDAELRPPLKKAGYLTRDPREVERKKYGKAGARRRYQYSKR